MGLTPTLFATSLNFTCAPRLAFRPRSTAVLTAPLYLARETRMPSNRGLYFLKKK
jgi:hypothetical protein